MNEDELHLLHDRQMDAFFRITLTQPRELELPMADFECDGCGQIDRHSAGCPYTHSMEEALMNAVRTTTCKAAAGCENDAPRMGPYAGFCEEHRSESAYARLKAARKDVGLGEAIAAERPSERAMRESDEVIDVDGTPYVQAETNGERALAPTTEQLVDATRRAGGEWPTPTVLEADADRPYPDSTGSDRVNEDDGALFDTPLIAAARDVDDAAAKLVHAKARLLRLLDES